MPGAIVLTRRWRDLGLTLDDADFTDAQAVAAIVRITGGNFRAACAATAAAPWSFRGAPASTAAGSARSTTSGSSTASSAAKSPSRAAARNASTTSRW
jgi:hypothetical protein